MSTSTRPPTPTSPEGSDLSGRTLHDFKLLRRLGQGGMGQVYLAEQISLKRKVALKLLRPEFADSPQALLRFKQEAESVAKATHANIVQVYACNTSDGMPYMALEYVEGRNLKEYVVKKGPPELLVAISIMRQTASALQRAAELGIIHRDIKPENILLTRKGEVKVADFGLARCLEGTGPASNLTQTGLTMGTPLYMSPEQVESKGIDSRSDIYSFGVTCYHMLAGQPPFRGASAFEVALQHVQSQPQPLAQVRPDLPPMLCAIVHKMMAKDPDQRYQTDRELLRDIIRLRESLGGASGAVVQPTIAVEATGSTPALSQDHTAAWPPVAGSRRRVLLVAAVVVSILLMGASGAAVGWMKRQRQEARVAGLGIKPADAGSMEEISPPTKRARMLHDLAEQYLNPPAGKATDLAGGFGVCMDLGQFYLDENRLEEADKLFARLEAMGAKQPSYQLLGRLGRAIVLALRNKAKESGALFHDIFFGVWRNRHPKGKAAGMGRIPPALVPIKPVLESLHWRYLIIKARWYNSKNGISDDPPFLRWVYPLRQGAPEPIKPEKK